MILIGISGKKQSGKDTVADILIDKLPQFRCRKLAFADALKTELCEMYKISRQYLDEHKEHFRLILQGHGTNYRRQLFGDDYWLKQYALQFIKFDNVDIVFTTDVRFINEAQVVHDSGGFLIRVTRNESAQVSDSGDKHLSETELDNYDKFDYRIRNDLSLQSLGLEIDELIQTLHKKDIL